MSDRVCNSCGKNAHLTRLYQIQGTQITEMWLCAECARRLGVERSKPRFSVVAADLLSALISRTATAECPTCGRTFDSIRHSGRVGCPECYRWFREEIAELLEREDLGGDHAGRVPRRLIPLKRLLIDRERLKDELRQAIQSEEYERAAGIRDHMNTLERDDETTG